MHVFTVLRLITKQRDESSIELSIEQYKRFQFGKYKVVADRRTGECIMNKNLSIVLAACVGIAGCPAPGLITTDSCATQRPSTKCNNPPNDAKVNVNRNSLNLSPRSVCVGVGETVEITLTPTAQNELGNAATVPKDAANTWLAQSNSSDKNKIYIPVPDWVPEGDYYYGLIFADGKCIDPRLEVTH